MKVLTSTKKGQGSRKNDFSWTAEGEVVMLDLSECPKEKIDGSCGCRRAARGIISNLSTTTFVVSDIDVTKNYLIQKVQEHYILDWNMKTEDALIRATHTVEVMLYVASTCPIGTILEKRGNRVKVR